ncbi:hypothetical protein PENTCL1PPCAC_18762, partial [Pristionchus entomophagus]
QVFKFVFDSATDDESALEYIRWCFGKRIGKVEFDNCGDNATWNYASKLLEGTQFKQFRVKADKLSGDDDNIILDAIKKHKVDDFYLEIRKVATADPVKFLVDLSSLVRSIYIWINPGKKIRGNSAYFFGLRNVDWAPIILDMFTKKMDKLCIDNSSRPEYLFQAS